MPDNVPGLSKKKKTHHGSRMAMIIEHMGGSTVIPGYSQQYPRVIPKNELQINV